MIWFQPAVGLAGFMLKIATMSRPRGVAEGACTPPGPTGPVLNLPAPVTRSFWRSVS